MSYATPEALRVALERRLLNRSNETGVGLDRLRRRVIFERIVVRLNLADPGRWVLKGGMALEIRLRDDARLTKDIDLGLRDDIVDEDDIRDRLIDALSTDPDDDGFVFTVGPAARLAEDGRGHLTWRLKVAVALAGRPFGGIQLDVSPRAHELAATEVVPLPNSLDFAGVQQRDVEIIDVHRHAAEKFHGMLKDFGDRENTRVRDLVDLVILHEHDLLNAWALAAALAEVWAERESVEPPAALPSLPASWRERYERLAEEHDLNAASFQDGVAVINANWAATSTTKDPIGDDHDPS